MARIRVDLDRDLDRVVREGVNSAVREAAEKILAEARRIAPVRSGGYLDGLEVRHEDGASFVRATDPVSAFVEYGTSNNPKYAVLRRAADAS